MTEYSLFLVIGLLLLNIVLASLIWSRQRNAGAGGLEKTLREGFREARDESGRQSRQLREEVAGTQDKANERLTATVKEMGRDQVGRLDKLTETTVKAGEATRAQIEKSLNEIRASNEDRFDRMRHAVNTQTNEMIDKEATTRREVIDSLNKLSESNRESQDKARKTLEDQFQRIQENNDRKLEEMRKTVDEKLHSTLEQRLGESFKLVSERLEVVQKGLGEMQSLAAGVGDLKRVLTNVRERGTWGEFQLGAILQKILTPDQYEPNVRPKGSGEVVEFAVKLPGKDGVDGEPVWLPIDAKFPKEDYERLQDAAAQSDAEGVKAATNALAATLRRSAKDISEKYIAPPHTTDFAIMFLPTEGLYAEVLRLPGLHDELQSRYRILATGPTTLAALLNSLRIGFRTLAIEQRSSEVWQVLGAVKTEFGKFGDVLGKVKRQLNTAVSTLDQTERRTRAMDRKLQEVEKLPNEEASTLLSLNDGDYGADQA